MMQGFFSVFSLKQNGQERMELLIQNIQRDLWFKSSLINYLSYTYIVIEACPVERASRGFVYQMQNLLSAIAHDAHPFDSKLFSAHPSHSQVKHAFILDCFFNCDIRQFHTHFDLCFYPRDWTNRFINIYFWVTLRSNALLA